MCGCESPKQPTHAAMADLYVCSHLSGAALSPFEVIIHRSQTEHETELNHLNSLPCEFINISHVLSTLIKKSIVLEKSL